MTIILRVIVVRLYLIFLLLLLYLFSGGVGGFCIYFLQDNYATLRFPFAPFLKQMNIVELFVKSQTESAIIFSSYKFYCYLHMYCHSIVRTGMRFAGVKKFVPVFDI